MNAMNGNINMNNQKRQDVLAYVLCSVFLLFCEWFFFRNIIMTDRLIGNYGDGRLTMLITEHWFHVFQGKAAAPDLGIFYQATNTLAYSDMLLGYGLIHSVLRSLGTDIFYAYKTTLMLVHLLGTFSTFCLLRRSLRTNFAWALFGTVTFSFTSTYAIHFAHTQLAMVSFLPLIAIFVLAFFKNLRDRTKRTLYAVLSILALALLLYTSWYMAFFTALFTATAAIITICTMEKQKILSTSKNFFKLLGMDLIFYFLLAVALVVPFVLLSLPVLRMSGGWKYGFLSYGPEFIDIINVSVNNWLLGPLLRTLKLDSRGYSDELVEGFSIILLIMFASLSYRIYKLNAKQSVRRYSAYRALVLSIIIGMLLVIRMSANGISLWFLVYYLFPGAKAIRAVARYFFFLSLPMSLITAVMGDDVSRLKKRSTWPALILLALAFIANIHISGVSSVAWNRGEQKAFLDNVAPPPSDCEVFCIVNPKRYDSHWAIQLDAYQIADHFGINTINGYSGNTPKGWDGIWEVGGDKVEYEEAVLKWIAANGLENVYAYDEGNNTWTKFNIAVPD